MSKRISTSATNGAPAISDASDISKGKPCTYTCQKIIPKKRKRIDALGGRDKTEEELVQGPARHGLLTDTPTNAAYDKQKDLLSNETGHFSLVRAMHLADLITELNGKSTP